MRKYYIDNLRWLAVLLLFPYHIFMIYNAFGESFYVKGPDLLSPTGFIVATWPWFMPLLFVVAGMSTAFALQIKSAGQYLKDRIFKLLIPLVAGILLLIPAQTYFAERFHNGYTGGYFRQYILFFTKPTDLSGYTGGFTPGHLWFILYLFLISLITLPILIACKKANKKIPLARLPLSALLALFILPLAGSLVLDIGGKSLGEYCMYFLLGYFVLTDEEVAGRLERYRFLLAAISILSGAAVLLWWGGVLNAPDIAGDIFSRFYAWTAILTLLGLGRRYLNFTNSVTAYLSKASFGVYLFHQTWIIAAAYYIFAVTDHIILQMALILLASALATFATFELFRRIGVTRFLFAIKR